MCCSEKGGDNSSKLKKEKRKVRKIKSENLFYFFTLNSLLKISLLLVNFYEYKVINVTGEGKGRKQQKDNFYRSMFISHDHFPYEISTKYIYFYKLFKIIFLRHSTLSYTYACSFLVVRLHSCCYTRYLTFKSNRCHKCLVKIHIFPISCFTQWVFKDISLTKFP